MASILVIDDETGVRDSLRQMLESAGHFVREAQNGLVGLRLFQAERPDLVVTDIIMPDMEGIETIRTIRAQAPDARILAISGGGRMGNVDFLSVAQRLGADSVLQKPFEVDEFLAKVSELLNFSRPSVP